MISYTGARVLGIDGDNFLLAFYKETGSFPGLTRHIYVQKFNGSGEAVWTSDVLASSSNGISAFTNFYIKSDNANGIIIAWGDDNDADNNLDCEVQHVNSDGTISWPANGVEVSSLNGFSHQNVRILGVNTSGEVIVAWDKKNSAQSQTSIAGQKFSTAGVRLWGNGGIEFVAMSANIFGNAGGAVFDGTDAMIVYSETTTGLNSHVKAFGIDGTGSFIWTPNITLVASRETEKSNVTVTEVYNDQLVAVWEEGSASDIYMQNIFIDGTLGFPPISDDATLSDLTVNDVTVEGFDPDIYSYNVAIPSGDPLPITGATANHPAATVLITQTTSVPGTATVLVTAEDAITQLTYTVNFYVAATDATLSDLTVNGVTIEGFSPSIFTYDYSVPTGDPIPVVGATPNDPNASVDITQASVLPGNANVLVTAEDGSTTNNYIVNFLYTPASDATLADLQVDGETIEGFDPLVFDYVYGVVMDSPVPFVDGVPNDPLASVLITQASVVPGNATLIVTAEDGVTTNTYTVSFYYMNNDATLIDLTVNGVTIADFDPEVFYYEYFVDAGEDVPVVGGTTTDPSATLLITQAEQVPGNGLLNVIAEDGVNESTYTVYFYSWSTDASLKDLTVDGTTIEGFDPLIYNYDFDVYEGDPIPVIDGTTNDVLATKEVTQANDLPGDAFIVVTAQDGTTQQTYNVHFNLITSVINNNQINISVYPNPVIDKMFVKGINNNAQIEILGLLGKSKYRSEITENQAVDLRFLSEGVYFAVIKDERGILKTIKFIKK